MEPCSGTNPGDQLENNVKAPPCWVKYHSGATGSWKKNIYQEYTIYIVHDFKKNNKMWESVNAILASAVSRTWAGFIKIESMKDGGTAIAVTLAQREG
jgi:hypothetical protein